jgi:predicted nucleotidyltransferase
MPFARPSPTLILVPRWFASDNGGSTMQLGESLKNTICDALVGLAHPEKIIVFGSYATGQADRQSDLDIAVIASDDPSITRETVIQCRLALRRALNEIGLPFDFIMQSTSQFEEGSRLAGSIQQTINAEGVVIYARH